MRVAMIGVGAVGTRLARQLVSGDESCEVVLRDEQEARVQAVAESLGERAIRCAPGAGL